MKKIAYTQRAEVIESYGEWRDCADQNIPRFLSACGFLPIPVMNIPSLAAPFCEELAVDGIFLTGGNDLADYGGTAPERDETEKILLEYGVRKGIPVFGICRGMQLIAHYYGTELVRVHNHVRRNHSVSGRINRTAVNSFHGMGVLSVSSPLCMAAVSDDGVAEAIRHEEKAVAGVMWHPERVSPFSQEDVKMIKNFFEGGVLN